MRTIKFQGYNITPQFMRTDKSVRVIIEISNDQREAIGEILLGKMPEGLYDIQISPVVEEEIN